jgi:hypothetical protein
MNRSVYVMDTPETCHSCPLADVNLRAVTIVCRATGELQDDTERGYEALKAGCPLRRLPEKRICNEYTWNEYHAGFDQGVNYAISAITGEKYTPSKCKEGKA